MAGVICFCEMLPNGSAGKDSLHKNFHKCSYNLHSWKVTGTQYCVSNQLGRKDHFFLRFQVPKSSHIIPLATENSYLDLNASYELYFPAHFLESLAT